MIDLFDLDPKTARDASADPFTDLACAACMGWRIETTDPRCSHGPSHKLTDGDQSVSMDGALKVVEGVHTPAYISVSQSPIGAHRAREWIRKQGRLPCVSHTQDGYIAGITIEHTVRANKSEHLATARLLLLLVAKGVVEPDIVPGEIKDYNDEYTNHLMEKVRNG